MAEAVISGRRSVHIPAAAGTIPYVACALVTQSVVRQ
jgi:hypothetical protein